MKKISVIKTLTELKLIRHLPFYKYEVIRGDFNLLKLTKPIINIDNELEKGDSLKIYFLETTIRNKKEYWRYVYYKNNESEFTVKLNPVIRIIVGYNMDFINFWANKGLIPNEIKIYQLYKQWKNQTNISLSKLNASQNKLNL